MHWISAWILLAGLLPLESCFARLDHKSSESLGAELKQKSREGLAVAAFNHSDTTNLSVFRFDEQRSAISFPCCPMTRDAMESQRVVGSHIVTVGKDAHVSVGRITGELIHRSRDRIFARALTLSKDAHTVIFVGFPYDDEWHPGPSGLYLLHLDQPGIERIFDLHPDARKTDVDVDLSPDSDRVLLSAAGAIMTVGVKNHLATLLKPGYYARWSPDGIHISYVRGDGVVVVSMFANFMSREKVIHDEHHGVIRSVSWSPDGKYW